MKLRGDSFFGRFEAAMLVKRWDVGGEIWDLIAVLRSTGALRSGCLYRGQCDTAWELIPSLYRRPVHIFGIDVKSAYLHAENRMIQTFFDRALLLLPKFNRSPLADRVVAQHYSIPTQLLDWTLDPFIAIYFAVEHYNTNTDAAVYFIETMRHVVSTEQVQFPFDEPMRTFFPPVSDERVRTQKSVFTLQSFGGVDAFRPLDDRHLKFSGEGQGSDPRDEVSVMGKIIIPSSRKQQILLQLMKMGVDASLVYPGLQGIGARIAAIAQIQNYGGDGLF
jgi:hypothetical protein